MTDKQFAEYIYNSTGKELGIDYGFEMGTQTPFTITKGLLSSHRGEGFDVWKVDISEQDERKFKRTTLFDEGLNKNLANVIEFLKNN